MTPEKFTISSEWIPDCEPRFRRPFTGRIYASFVNHEELVMPTLSLSFRPPLDQKRSAEAVDFLRKHGLPFGSSHRIPEWLFDGPRRAP